MSHSLSCLCMLAGGGLLWAALLVQVFYLQESKCSKKIKYICEISVCFHDEQTVCGHNYSSQLWTSRLLLILLTGSEYRNYSQICCSGFACFSLWRGLSFLKCCCMNVLAEFQSTGILEVCSLKQRRLQQNSYLVSQSSSAHFVLSLIETASCSLFVCVVPHLECCALGKCSEVFNRKLLGRFDSCFTWNPVGYKNKRSKQVGFI